MYFTLKVVLFIINALSILFIYNNKMQKLKKYITNETCKNVTGNFNTPVSILVTYIQFVKICFNV